MALLGSTGCQSYLHQIVKIVRLKVPSSIRQATAAFLQFLSLFCFLSVLKKVLSLIFANSRFQKTGTYL